MSAKNIIADTKMLKLAALAAGLGQFTIINGTGCVYAPKLGYLQPYREWNPLTSSGDAFELAVSLNILRTCAYDQNGYIVNPDGTIAETSTDDPYAATRRAIVRMAAEIGMAVIGKPQVQE